MRTKNATVSRLLLGGLFASIAFAGVSKAHAQGKGSQSAAKPAGPTAAPSASQDEKVDISDLENKYWAPKDTDFSVVQNRTYTKEKRKFISLQYGLPTSEAYSDGSFLGVTGNYFFSERHGIQLSYLKANLQPNAAVKDLANFGATGVYPDHSRMRDYWSVGYNFVPFYSKMSFMGKKIIYFDMAFTPTLGMTNYEQVQKTSSASSSSLTYGLDVTQYYFFSNHFAVRLDWKNQWYSQKVQKYQNTNLPTPAKEGDPVATKFYHDSVLLLGATFFW